MFPQNEHVWGLPRTIRSGKVNKQIQTLDELMKTIIFTWSAAIGVVTPEFGLVLSQAYV